MKNEDFQWPGNIGNTLQIPEKIRTALVLLIESHQYAEQTSGDKWEFAVEIEELVKLGLRKNDLRWLVRRGYVEHAREITANGEASRTFHPTGDLKFSKNTCFVLSANGAIATREIQLNGLDNGAKHSSLTQGLPFTTDVVLKPSVPEWDVDRRELRFGDRIIKRFKWHAANQETVLAAFQEEGWPHRIDDPLSPRAEQDSKRRLSDTIKCLNRKQQHRIIHFRGDGAGEGVVWDLCDATYPNEYRKSSQ
jgi:hypothetical protein